MNSTKITVVARILVKEEKRDFVKNELMKLIDITRKEKGCINYDLHQDNNNPNLFIFHENWENKELLETHLQNDHLKQYLEATDGCVNEFIIHELTQIG